ncbi:hypothetical protein C2E23DRAFT_804582 [Lenzites betulinus]|nr:hypothetical protein C2E23DRAFT_804582 [Lenzites betulinus]
MVRYSESHGAGDAARRLHPPRSARRALLSPHAHPAQAPVSVCDFVNSSGTFSSAQFSIPSSERHSFRALRVVLLSEPRSVTPFGALFAGLSSCAARPPAPGWGRRRTSACLDRQSTYSDAAPPSYHARFPSAGLSTASTRRPARDHKTEY